MDLSISPSTEKNLERKLKNAGNQLLFKVICLKLTHQCHIRGSEKVIRQLVNIAFESGTHN